MTRGAGTARRTLAVALAVAIAVLAAGAHRASAHPTSVTKVTATCWQDIVNDWLDHNGQIKGTYPIPCYRQAITHLNGYADIQGYSNIIDDIHRALIYALHHPGASGSGPGGSAGGSGPGGSSGGSGPGTSASHNEGWVQSLADEIGPSQARSIPLPLLVLGALALLLLLAAAGTWLAKRIQMRRVAPSPAPAPLPRDRR